MGRHIPGNPTVVPRNMPGGGSLVAANHIFNVAPKDGTTLGLIAPTAPLEERLGASNVRFKAAQFNFIGRMAATPSVTFTVPSSPVKTIQDALVREASLGATGRSSTVTVYPNLLNHVVGTKFKLVMGYKGSPEAMLAMERGEVEGHTTTWDGMKSRAEQHLRDKTINMLVQYGLKRHPELPDVPASVELGRTPEQIEALRVFASATDVGRFPVRDARHAGRPHPGAAARVRRDGEGSRIHRRPEAAEARARAAHGRGIAEAGGGGGERLAGDDRARPRHLFRTELIASARRRVAGQRQIWIRFAGIAETERIARNG